MTWQDRDYNQTRRFSFDRSSMALGFPKPTRFVLYLIIANVAIFILTAMDRQRVIDNYFALIGVGNSRTPFELWRLVSYQFLHGNPGHIFWNMLGLYFFGPPLERYWGPAKFIFFYLFCGVVGGLTYLVMSSLTPMPGILIGASGSILGLVAASAVLFPQMIIFLVIFPVPIRVAALLIAGMSVLYIISDKNLAEACHLGGMAAGFCFTMARPFWQKFSSERIRAKRQSLLDQEEDDQKKVDQILEKVHRQGIQNLTRMEKRTLRDITHRQKMRDDLRKHKW
ncbi:MAG: rhomboid family intramembrane serine protease [Phycisphaerae bacterium]